MCVLLTILPPSSFAFLFEWAASFRFFCVSHASRFTHSWIYSFINVSKLGDFTHAICHRLSNRLSVGGLCTRGLAAPFLHFKWFRLMMITLGEEGETKRRTRFQVRHRLKSVDTYLHGRRKQSGPRGSVFCGSKLITLHVVFFPGLSVPQWLVAVRSVGLITISSEVRRPKSGMGKDAEDRQKSDCVQYRTAVFLFP